MIGGGDETVSLACDRRGRGRDEADADADADVEADADADAHDRMGDKVRIGWVRIGKVIPR